MSEVQAEEEVEEQQEREQGGSTTVCQRIKNHQQDTFVTGVVIEVPLSSFTVIGLTSRPLDPGLSQ